MFKPAGHDQRVSGPAVKISRFELRTLTVITARERSLGVRARALRRPPSFWVLFLIFNRVVSTATSQMYLTLIYTSYKPQHVIFMTREALFMPEFRDLATFMVFYHSIATWGRSGLETRHRHRSDYILTFDICCESHSVRAPIYLVTLFPTSDQAVVALTANASDQAKPDIEYSPHQRQEITRITATCVVGMRR